MSVSGFVPLLSGHITLSQRGGRIKPVLLPREGGTSLFSLNGYVSLNTVWYSGSCVLYRVYNFTI